MSNDVLRRLESELNVEQAAADAKFSDLAEQIADGESPSSNQVKSVLKLVNKTMDELKKAVDNVHQRRRERTQQQAHDELFREEAIAIGIVREADVELEDARRRHTAKVAPHLAVIEEAKAARTIGRSVRREARFSANRN